MHALFLSLLLPCCPTSLPTLIHHLPSITMPGQSDRMPTATRPRRRTKGPKPPWPPLPTSLRLYDSRRLRRVGDRPLPAAWDQMPVGMHLAESSACLAPAKHACSPAQRDSSATVPCCASSTHARLQILISSLPKFSNPAFLVFPASSYSQRTVENHSCQRPSLPLHCLGAMNSNKIFAPLGPRERRCKLHENPHRVDVMIGVCVSACLPPA